jgi:IPT/TIG domain
MAREPINSINRRLVLWRRFRRRKPDSGLRWGNLRHAFPPFDGASSFYQPNPVFGKAGQTINVLGSNLTGATRVTFNGVSASFEVFSATDIKAEVPAAATTGTLRVTPPGGTLSTDVAFQVLP